jgi:hypothetical protein
MSVVEHCWNIEIGGAGFAAGNGTALVAQTVCWNDPNLTINGTTLTYTFTGLIPGTCYDWYVSETCDGVLPPFNNSGWSFVGPQFCTFDSPFDLAFTAMKPTCPEVSPGYVPNGSFSVTVTDPTTCPGGLYNLVATPVIGSSPLGNTPPATPNTYLGVPAGTYNFSNAGAGDYTVNVTQVGICNPINDPDAITVTVPDGMDMVEAIWYLGDVLGNVIADNDPFTVPGTAVNLGVVTIPEGSCSYQQQLYAFGIDNCDGLITNPAAVVAVANTTPATVVPGTQVNVVPDGLGQYLVDINWAIGTSTVTFTGMDAAGNMTDLTVTATVDDNVDPTIAASAESYTIPACATTISPVFGFTIIDGCDQFIDDANLTVTISGFAGATVTRFFPAIGTQNGYVEYTLNNLTAGSGFLTISYTDANGNNTFVQPEITVTQAVEDAAPVIVAADENITVALCEDLQFVAYSFQIFDDCADINTAAIGWDDGGSGLAISFIDAQGTTAFVEVTGFVAPNPFGYFPTITYPGAVTVQPGLNVLGQQDQGAVITMPGNLNYTIPVCEDELTTTWSITMSDDCDSAADIVAGATFTLGGAPVVPVFANPFNDNQAYFEFESTLTAAANGAFIVASYTDGAGNTTTVDAQVTITSQPDNWAPIIVYPCSGYQRRIG